MKKQIIILMLPALFLAGCAGGKLDRYTGKVDAEGDPVMEESTESVEALRQTARAVEALKDIEPEEKKCGIQLTADEIAALKEQGQQTYFFSVIMCGAMMAVVDVTKSARDLPTTREGEIFHSGFKSVTNIETTDRDQNADAIKTGGNVATAGIFGLVLHGAFQAASGEYNVGDISMSNSGDQAGGAGVVTPEGAAPGGESGGQRRSQQLVIGENNNLQSVQGDSNAWSNAEKSPVFESSSNVTFDDRDEVRTGLVN